MTAILQTAEFAKWLHALTDARAFARIDARIARMAAGNLGDVKSVGGGVSEARIDFGPGYRLYFTRRGAALIVLLCGGDKESQRRDIERARRIAGELEG